MKSHVLVHAAAGLAVILAAAPAAATSARHAAWWVDTPRPVVLRYAELDLTNRLGARTLVARIRQAAHTACSPEPSVMSLEPRIRYETCVARTMDAAVAEVAAPLVTAAYADIQTRDRLAAN